MPIKALIQVNSPNYLWVSKKPLKLGGIPEKLHISDIVNTFNFKYSENIWISEEISNHNFGHNPNNQNEWIKISSYALNPLNDKLVICYINEKVGYGVFAKEIIKAGTIVALYSGEIIPRSSATSNYGMAIKGGNNDCFAVDSKNIGGIARFIQHMPFSTKRVVNFIKNSDLDSFFPRLFANGILLDEETVKRLRKIENVDQIMKNEKFSESLEEINKDIDEEIKTITFFENIENVLACANIKQYCILYNQKPVVFYEACIDIQPGEQLGVTYNQNYWLTRNIFPELFYLDGGIIPSNKYSRLVSQGKSDQYSYGATDHLFKGIFAQTHNKHTELKKEMIKKYKLSDDSLTELERGLRKAAHNNIVTDISIFKLLGVNINAQDNKLLRTALHLAVLKNSVLCVQELLKFGARYDIKDESHLTALDYANDISKSEILNLFSTQSRIQIHANERLNL